ncbi:MAG: DsrE/DsrF/DrsH-like family protein [Acidobacteria bacterium]|nr:DsrE/DsrF/DrsH-like family protein [Acidobacteriota bacterium]
MAGNGMAGEDGKLALIVNTAAFDRVAFALNVANTAAAMGQETVLLFGYGALVRLKKGSADEVGEETPGWIREQVKAGLQKGNLVPISQLLDSLMMMGGKIYACPTAMALHNLTKAELIEGVTQVCGLAEFLGRDARESMTVLYV